MNAVATILSIGLALTSLPLAAAQLYQWKDAQGRIVYSDQAPPTSVKNVEHKNFKGSVIEVGESYAARTARQKNPVTLYASACGAPCDMARQLLTERGVPFSNRDPQTDAEAQGALQKLTGRTNVPVLVVGGDKMDGFETSQWQAMLDRAGYPKAGPASRKPPAAVPTAPAVPAPAN